MDVSLIVAKSSNNVIGCDNKLPWRIPEDLKLFKEITTAKAIIMGRKTYESLGRPLPHRLNIVMTRSREFQAPGCTMSYSFDEALSAAKQHARLRNQSEIMVIGGAEIFEAALSFATKLYLTTIPKAFDGDAFFPMHMVNQWCQVEKRSIASSSEGIGAFEFSVLARETKSPHRSPINLRYGELVPA